MTNFYTYKLQITFFNISWYFYKSEIFKFRTVTYSFNPAVLTFEGICIVKIIFQL